MVLNAYENDLVEGLFGNLVDNGVRLFCPMQMIILCIKDDIDMARNMIFLLYIYVILSGRRLTSLNVRS